KRVEAGVRGVTTPVVAARVSDSSVSSPSESTGMSERHRVTQQAQCKTLVGTPILHWARCLPGARHVSRVFAAGILSVGPSDVLPQQVPSEVPVEVAPDRMNMVAVVL